MSSLFDLFYLIGAISGDGYLRSGTKSKTDLSPDYRIAFELTDIDYLKNVIYVLLKQFTQTNAQVRVRSREGKLPSAIIEVRNKSFFNFLTLDLGMHSGPKDSFSLLPQSFWNLPMNLKREFVAGYFDTDGGIRGHTLGFTTKTISFHKFVSSVLLENEIQHTCESWINPKIGSEYYGIRIWRSSIDSFLNAFPLRNKYKLARCVGVPEWSNGLEKSTF